MSGSDGKFYLIVCVVQRGMGDKVWKSAKEAGAGGVTINFARGMGVRERLGILGVAISPEKEVLHIVVSEGQLEPVFDAIVKSAKLDSPGMGIAYALPVVKIAGLVEQKRDK